MSVVVRYERPETAGIWRDMVSAEARGVIVRAMPGAGKTTLLRSVSARLQANLAGCVITLEGDRSGAQVPFAALREGLRAAGPRFAAVLESTSTAEGACITSDALLSALRSACPQRLALVVDDVHLVDPDSVDLLVNTLAAAHRVAAPITALVMAPLAGPEVPPVIESLLGRLPSVVEHRLEPLGVGEVTRLTESLLGAPVEPELAESLTTASGGLPFAVALRARQLDEDQRLVRRDGRIGARELDGPHLRVSSTSGSLVRFADPLQARIAGGLAVLGSADPAAATVVSEYLGAEPGAVDATVAHLLERQLLRVDGGHLRFAAPVLRNELAAELGPLMRAGLHRLAARNLMAGEPRGLAELSELAYHLAESIGPGDGREAVVLAHIAEQLMAAAPRRALELLEPAIEAMAPGTPERSTAVRHRVRLLQRLGRHEQTIAEAAALFQAADDARALDHVGLAVTTSLLLTCRVSTAIAVAEEAARRAPGQTPQTAVAHCLSLVLARELDGLDEPLQMILQSDSDAIRALAANAADLCAAATGNHDHVPTDPAGLDELLRTLGPIEAAVALTHYALFQPLMGRIELARHATSEPACTPVMPIVMASDALDAMWRVGRAVRLYSEGNWTTLDEQLADLGSVHHQWPALGVIVGWLQAEMGLHRDRFDEAIRLINDLDRLPALAPLLTATAIRALAASGQLPDALGLGHEQLDLDRASGSLVCRHVLARTLFQLETDPDRRRALGEELDRTTDPEGRDWPRINALLTRAQRDHDPGSAVRASRLAAAGGVTPLVHEGTVVAAELGGGSAEAIEAAMAWAAEQRHHELFLRAFAAKRAMGDAAPTSRRSKGGPTDIERFLVITAARGETNQQIAARLGVGVGTVKTYLQRLYRKLEVSNRSEFVAVTAKHGWRT